MNEYAVLNTRLSVHARIDKTVIQLKYTSESNIINYEMPIQSQQSSRNAFFPSSVFRLLNISRFSTSLSTLQARINVGLDSRTPSSLIIAMQSAMDGMLMLPSTVVEDVSHDCTTNLSKADLYAV